MSATQYFTLNTHQVFLKTSASMASELGSRSSATTASAVTLVRLFDVSELRVVPQ